MYTTTLFVQKAKELIAAGVNPNGSLFARLFDGAETVTLETREGVCLSVTPARMPYCVQFYGWEGAQS